MYVCECFIELMCVYLYRRLFVLKHKYIIYLMHLHSQLNFLPKQALNFHLGRD